MERLTEKPADGTRVFDVDDVYAPAEFFGAWVAASEIGDDDYVEIRYDDGTLCAALWRELYK
jgi:hypothetical protein